MTRSEIIQPLNITIFKEFPQSQETFKMQIALQCGEMWSFWVLVEHKYFLQLHNHCASTIPNIIDVKNNYSKMSYVNVK